MSINDRLTHETNITTTRPNIPTLSATPAKRALKELKGAELEIKKCAQIFSPHETVGVAIHAAARALEILEAADV